MKIFDVRWECTTAGPSPDNNQRTEVFLLGCRKAIKGNPCKGCFNSSTWDNSKCTINHSVDSCYNIIKHHSSNKYITFGGGEPSDQLEELIKLCKLLKQDDYHIMVYTYRDLKTDNYMYELYEYVDIIIDGEFKMEERLYKENAEDGTYNSIGSGNQTVWSKHENSLIGYKLKDIEQLKLDNKKLIYKLHKGAVRYEIAR